MKNNFKTNLTITQKVIFISLLIILIISLIPSINKLVKLRDLPLSISGNITVVDEDPIFSVDLKYTPFICANFDDGRTVTAYPLPTRDVTKKLSSGSPTLHTFSDSTILYSYISAHNLAEYSEYVTLLDVKTRKQEAILKVSELNDYENLDFHMSKQYVLISSSEYLYIYDRKTSSGEEIKIESIIANNRPLRSSTLLHENLIFTLTSNSIISYDLNNSKIVKEYPISTAKDIELVSSSDDYIVFQTISSGGTSVEFFILNQSDGAIYDFNTTEDHNILSCLDSKDKIVLQIDSPDKNSIVFDKATSEFTRTNEAVINSKTSTLQKFGLVLDEPKPSEDSDDDYSYLDPILSLVDLENQEKTLLSLPNITSYEDDAVLYVNDNSFVITQPYLSTYDIPYLLILE